MVSTPDDVVNRVNCMATFILKVYWYPTPGGVVNRVNYVTTFFMTWNFKFEFFGEVQFLRVLRLVIHRSDS